MGASHGYQHGPQRGAGNAKAAAAAATKKPVCKHRSLSTPPLPGVCAVSHCQGPLIQGQLPRENTQCASDCCNVTAASAATGSPRIPYPAHPPAWVSQRPLISCSFNPVLSGREQMPSGDLHAKAGPIQRWTPGTVWTKKRKGNFSQQPQEQQIKSLQSTWCTLHLSNTWIENESYQIWGGGLWEQL